MSQRIRHQQEDQDAIEHREIAHHLQHRLLLRTDDMSRANQLSRATKLGADARRRDFRDRLASLHQRAGKGLKSRPGFGANGFTGEHGLIEQDIPVGELYVRRYNAAER
jgi:hypothetical protein